MNLEQIMQQVAEPLGAAQLSPDERGRYLLRFDDQLDIEVCSWDRSTLLLQAVIGHAPEEDWAAQSYLESVLTRSVMQLHQGAEVVCLNPTAEALLLQRTIQTTSLTADRFLASLEQFINRTEEWTNFLANEHRSPQPTIIGQMKVLMP